MTPTLTLSPLALEIAAALAEHTHFYAFEGVGIGTRCILCGTTWRSAEAWAADSGVCPGYVSPCGMDPVLTQPLSIGPVGEEG